MKIIGVIWLDLARSGDPFTLMRVLVSLTLSVTGGGVFHPPFNKIALAQNFMFTNELKLLDF